MVLHEYRSDKIVEYIKTHPQYRTVAIALSGDVGFYSGARKLIDLLDGDVQVICGISSVVYFMAKIGLSWMMQDRQCPWKRLQSDFPDPA